MNLKEKFKKKEEDSMADVNFGKEVFKKLLPPIVIFELLTMCLCILLGEIRIDKLAGTIVSGIIVCLGLNILTLAIATNLTCQSITEDLVSFYNDETTEKERTKLMKQLMAMPTKVGIVVLLSFAVTGVIWTILVVDSVKLSQDSYILFALGLVIGGYYTSIYAITGITQKICSRYASEIVEKGVSKTEVDKNHTFGTKSSLITVMHIFIPILLASLSIFILAWRVYVSYIPLNLVFKRLYIIGIVAMILYHLFSNSLFKRMMRSINNMKDLLGGINKENLHKVKFERTDLSNEFMYNVYLINTIVGILQKILKESQRISMDVIESSNELSVISRETAVTSLEQTSGIKELLSAMEETDALSKNISEKIAEVSLVAKRTTDNIGDGFDILKQNMQKLDEIRSANNVTVEGIQKLTEKISGISDIARIINSIADQTNIIAFNAELEASSAGEVGENFSLVANEIRRLTNSTIQSTNEIRNRIIEIQHSSDALLEASQNGSKKILDGTKIITDLNTSFEELQHSSESMDYASEDIKKIIEQQTASFAQIVITLRQISEAAETFSGSTQKISDSAQNLCTISDRLKQLQPEDMEANSDKPAEEKAAETISTSEVK
ncbi:MAG: methyl-accepting chemotaxis protein [Treponema sp.]|nr:methyl-accepting chemotaxis protein [Treponema sp.]